MIMDFSIDRERFETKLKTTDSYLLQRQSPGGFSLLEAMIVVVILSLAGATAIPHLIAWRSNMSLTGAVNELKGNLASAKALAARENTTFWVNFEPAAGRYRLIRKDEDDNDICLKEEQLPGGVIIDSTHPEYTLTDNKTSFNSRGGADNCTIVFAGTNGRCKLIAVSIIGKVEVRD
jgi:Tfp pilus assembly protein FimT